MSLSGLLAALRPDPGVAAVLDAARAGGISTLDVVAPAGVRPVVVAGMAHPDGADRPVLLVTATGRESEDLASALRCYLPEHAVAEFPAWETLPHERLSPRSDTVGRRLAVLRRLAHPDEAGDGGWSGGCACSSPRSAPSCSPWSPASGSCGRCGCARATTSASRRPSRRWSGPPTPAPTWSSGVASSPSAGASSTSSRPPRTTRCGWSSGATRSRRCAGSPSPTSARWRWPSRGCGPRPAGRSCSRTPSARAPPRSSTGCPGSPTCCSRSPRGSPSRAWSRWRRPWSTGWSRCSTCCPPARTSSSSTPRRSAPAPTTWSRPATSSSPRRGRTPRPATSCRSTSPRWTTVPSTCPPRPTGRSPGCGRTRWPPASPGGRSPP